MSGGSSGGTTTQVQKADPWEPLQPYIQDILPQLAGAATNIPEYYPDQTYADFDPLQEQAFQQQLGYAGSDPLQQAIRNQFGALDYGLTSVYDPENNPTLQKYVASATRPLTQAYEETVGNTLAGGAEGAGGFGGSRQGVAEGLAGRSYLDAVGDVSSDIYKSAYDKGLDQQARMMAFAPQTMQAGLFPSDILGQVGSQYQGQQQRAIDESMGRYDYEQNAEYSRLNDFFNTLMGQGFGSSSTTGPNPNQSNRLAGGLGGALGGAALGNALSAGTVLGAGPGMLALGPAGLGLGAAGLLAGAFL